MRRMSHRTLLVLLGISAAVAFMTTGCLPKPYEVGAPDSTLNGYLLAWQLVDQHYGGFCVRPEVDWDQAYLNYRAAAEQADTWEGMAEAALLMMGEMMDIGLIIHDASYTSLNSWDLGKFENFDTEVWQDYMETWGLPDTTLGSYGAGMVGPSGADSTGYIYVSDLGPVYGIEAFFGITGEVQYCQGLIIDLRMCGQGGMEVNARSAVGRFVTQSAVGYHRSERNGPGRYDMSDTLPVSAYKNGGWQLTGPTLVLTGRGTSGVGELFALLLNTQSHVTLIGDTTAGFASPSVLLDLSGGWMVAVPTMVAYDPSMVAVFDRGIPPDVSVTVTQADFDAGIDPVLDTALDMLSR